MLSKNCRVSGRAGALVAALSGAVLAAQSANVLRIPRDHPAIEYSSRPTRDAVAMLNRRIQSGEIQLAFDPSSGGYLKSVLAALAISPASQALVFSENSLQRSHINKGKPRAIYFNDIVALGWAQGAETMEAAVLDPAQGVQFYSIAQKPLGKPQFLRRNNECLECHLSAETYAVPGVFTMSVLPLSDNPNEYAQGWVMDHRTPIEDRWGGWYVTGVQVPRRHLGNVPVLHVPKSYVRADVAPALQTGSTAFNTAAYPTPHSDVAALMVLNHQTHMTNLLTRLGWAARIAAHEGAKGSAWRQHVDDLAQEVVDYMLFVDEAPFPSPVRGASGFAKEFSARGPHDRKGRSLRELDLTQRLFRYPCSYMIYTEAFDALPADAKNAVYERMWGVLSGRTSDKVYAKLSPVDRRAIVEILRDTKKELPSYIK